VSPEVASVKIGRINKVQSGQIAGAAELLLAHKIPATKVPCTHAMLRVEKIPIGEKKLDTQELPCQLLLYEHHGNSRVVGEDMGRTGVGGGVGRLFTRLLNKEVKL
jgi:hypothetical protein